MNILKRKNENLLDAATADQMLKNVFDVCEVDQNTVPLDELVSYSNYRKDRFLWRKIFLVVIMLIFLTIPLFFLAPEVESIEIADNSTTLAYNMKVDSKLAVTSVKASIDGKEMPVYEKKKNLYSIEPTTDGIMTITIECVNHQYTSKTVEVTDVDNNVPSMVSYEIKGGSTYIYLEDEGLGIDYSGIYAVSLNDDKIKPTSYDADANYITFDYPTPSLTVYIPDKANNTLQLVLTVN